MVPDDLRASIGSWAGAAGQAWLASLPGLVSSLAADWELTLGEVYQPSGYTSLALRALRSDGTPCVLKVRFADEWTEHAGAALRAYGGGASVALLAEDTERDALLLERCEPGTSLLAEPDDVATRVIAELLPELWRPAGAPFMRLPDAAVRFAARVRESAVLDPALRDETLEVLDWLTPDVAEPVLLHCDLHPGNVLRAERRPWLAIDPIPSVGDPAYDLASVLRDRAAPELVPRRYAIACEVTGLDPARVRGWALVQSVEGAAWCHEVGDTRNYADFLLAAGCIRRLP